MRLQFTKMHGLGNDFVVIDGVSRHVELSAEQVRRLADRKRGIGCDQILVIEPPLETAVDFEFSIYNADGGRVGQCGNGARCLAVFAREKGLTEKRELRVRTMTTDMTLAVGINNEVTVEMGVPEFEPSRIPFVAEKQRDSYGLRVNGDDVSIAALALGNPHAVQLVDDVDAAPVEQQGPLIESHASFPQRVNAAYLEVIDREHAKVRVYERGVGETLACGSGACAAVVAGKRWGLLNEQVNVRLPGGDLRICWHAADSPVMMTGPAIKVFDGEIEMDTIT